MSRRIFAGVGRDAALAGIAVLGVALAWSEPARAQEDPGAALPNAAAVPRWQFTPSIAVTQGFTDNVRATSKNRESDFYTRISPGFTISSAGGRVTGSASYQMGYDAYYNTSDLSGFRHSLVGTGRAELVDEALFVEVNASLSRQAISREDAISVEDRSVGRNETDVFSYTISPYYRSRFGGWAESELRYQLGQVYFITPDNSVDNDSFRQSSNLSSNSTSHRLSGDLKSGSYFSRVLWKLHVDAANTERDNGTFKSRTVEAETDYVINRTIKAILQTGYDDFDDPTLTNDLSGPFVLGGFELTPGPRSKLRFTAGERRNGFVMNGNLSYKLSDQLAFDASYTDSIETEQSRLLNNLGFLIRDPFGNFIDSRTGQIFTDRDLAQLRLTDSVFRLQQLLASLSGRYDVNSFAITAYRTVREPQGDTSADASTLGVETVYGLNVNYGRQLSPYLTGNISASISQSETDGGDGRSDVTVRGSASLRYLFSSTLTGAFTISYLSRDRKNDSSPTSTTSPSRGDLRETAVTASLIKTF
jgi:uncharacterized protein (PEP-CTERM system associated)